MDQIADSPLAYSHAEQMPLFGLSRRRILSTQIDAWRGLTVLEVNKDSAVLQVRVVATRTDHVSAAHVHTRKGSHTHAWPGLACTPWHIGLVCVVCHGAGAPSLRAPVRAKRVQLLQGAAAL